MDTCVLGKRISSTSKAVRDHSLALIRTCRGGRISRRINQREHSTFSDQAAAELLDSRLMLVAFQDQLVQPITWSELFDERFDLSRISTPHHHKELR